MIYVQIKHIIICFVSVAGSNLDNRNHGIEISYVKGNVCVFVEMKTAYALNKIVLLQENLPKSALPARVVLKVEFVKSVECVLVHMYI